MSYTARPQNSPLATARRASHTPSSASPTFQSSSLQSQARFAGHANTRKHASHAPLAHRPAHHRQVLPPGIEEQPF
jgi:hypothetical protein